jgi:hypothetical protein
MKDDLLQEHSDNQEFVMWTRVIAISDYGLHHETDVTVFRKVQYFILFVQAAFFILLKS